MKIGTAIIFMLSYCVLPTWSQVSITSASESSINYDSQDCGSNPIFTTSGSSTGGGLISYSISTIPDSSGVFTHVASAALMCDKAAVDTAGHSTYSITLTGRDGALTGTLVRTVTFTDIMTVPNQAPVIQPVDPVTVYTDKYEQAPAVPVVTLSASDDSGSYSLAITGDAGPFSLSGSDILVASTIASMTGTFELTVVATDEATPPLSSSVTVTITFTVRPRIVVPADGASITICEVDPVGNVVTPLTIEGDQLATVTVTSGPDIFEIVGTDLKLKQAGTEPLSSSIDYEVKKDDLPFTLELSVSTSTITVNIYIEDHNDNAPVISGTLTATVEQSSPVGTSVYNVTASDADGSAPNNALTFALSAGSATHRSDCTDAPADLELQCPYTECDQCPEQRLGSGDFAIDNNGRITVAGSLNYNTMDIYVINVTATDGAPAPDTKSTTEEMRITVEIAPSFVDLSQDKGINIPEDWDINDPIYTFIVQDQDGVVDDLVYGIVVPPTGNQFSLNGNSLVTSTPLDAETQTTHEFVFSASDGTYTTQSGKLTVTITDVNDNSPVIASDPVMPTSSEFELLDTTLTGYVFVTFTAEDADVSSPNSVVTLSLPDNGGGKFAFDPQSGTVATVGTFTYTEASSFDLVVVATDGALQQPRSSSVPFRVKLVTAATFEDKGITIPEDHDISTPVTTLVATDPDGVGTLTYDIASQPSGNPFSLAGSNLFTSVAFDAETETTYTVVIRVSDGINAANTGTLTITIGDVNDHTPDITPSGPQSVFIIDSTPPGTEIKSFAATDGDLESPNKDVTFSLTGDGHEDFEIDPNSGVVKTRSALDFTKKGSYSLTVTATDGATDPNKKSVSVSLEVTLDTRPLFDDLSENKSINIDENNDITTPVYTLSVTDPDNVGTPVYDIVFQSPGNQFSLNDAKLSTSAVFDAEAKITYELRFRVTDGKYTTESQTLSIVIDDMNDNTPVITPSQQQSISINETTPIETQLTQFTASDGDVTSPNNAVTFSLSGVGSGKFSIDPISGVVKTASTFSYADRSSYSLDVFAVDGGTTSRSASVSLVITLKTAPAFGNLYENRNINITEDNVDPIYTLSVTDLDGVGNLVYDIVSQSPGNHFSLDGNTLKSSALDAETQTTYTLVFSAKDGEFTTESKNLAITVIDVNDNKPVFAPITVDNYNENTPVGTSLFTIQATDADITSPNNLVNYALSGANAAYFDINITTGEVSLKRAFNYSELSTVLFNVEASDGGTGNAKQTTVEPVTFSIFRDTVTGNTNGYKIQKTVSEVYLNASCPLDLNSFTTYTKVKGDLTIMWNERRPDRIHEVANITCGSLVHDVTFITNSTASVQEDMQYLFSGGTLNYSGQTVVVSSAQIEGVTFSNRQPNKAALLCGVFEAVEPCPLNYECAVQNGTAFCEELQEDNFGLIIGVLGALLGLLFLVLVGVVALYLSKRSSNGSRTSKRTNRSSHNSRDFGGPNYPLREGRGWQNSIGFDHKVSPPYRY